MVDPGPVGLLGIFGSIFTQTYVLDRFQDLDLSHVPTLVQLVEKAMDVLDGRSNNGFFLVIEGAYPDFLGHNLDFPGLLAETLEFNEAVQAVLDRFGGDGETLIVATNDHETGGLVLEGDPACEERKPEDCDPYNLAFVDSVESADKKTQARLEELANKSTEGELTSAEQIEYQDYVQATDLISILQLKAKNFLGSQSGV